MSAHLTPSSAIVIGGSAGAIEVLMEVLPALPATLSACVLVVLHLPRDKPSLLVDIFAPRCALPVSEAQDGAPLLPGTITFAPPDYHVLVDEGPRISLSIDAPVHYSRPSIDVLFESAADALGPQLVGVLLSGANADGAHGLKAIADAGGLTLVQAPETALAPAMPRAALAALEALETLARIAQPSHTAPPAQLARILVDLHARSLL